MTAERVRKRRTGLGFVAAVVLAAAIVSGVLVRSMASSSSWHPHGIGAFRLVSTQYLGRSFPFASPVAPTAVAAEIDGGVALAGYTFSDAFPVVHAVQPRKRDRKYIMDSFVARLDAAGRIVFSTYFGGRGFVSADAVATDRNGNVYITGLTDSPDLPLRHAVQPHRSHKICPCTDAFLAKFSPGGQLVYSTYLGGDANDGGLAVTADAEGNAYVTGFTSSANFPTRLARQAQYAGPVVASSEAGAGEDVPGGDAFVAKFGPSGGLAFSTYLGGSGDDSATGIALDGRGHIIVTGNSTSRVFPKGRPRQSKDNWPSAFITDSTDFPTYGGIEGYTTGTDCAVYSSTNAFLAELTPTGQLVASTYIGRPGVDKAVAVTVDRGARAVVAGALLVPSVSATTSITKRYRVRIFIDRVGSR